MGWTHFLTKTLEHVSTEMSLHVLAYNMKRVINIMGVESLIEAILAMPTFLRQKTPFLAIIRLLRNDLGSLMYSANILLSRGALPKAA